MGGESTTHRRAEEAFKPVLVTICRVDAPLTFAVQWISSYHEWSKELLPVSTESISCSLVCS